LEYRSRLDWVGDVEEARWSWRHSKGSVSPSATIRQLEGARRHFGKGRLWNASLELKGDFEIFVSKVIQRPPFLFERIRIRSFNDV
jgi:hypothetical protein